MTQKLSNNATAELMEDLGSRALPASTLPHDKEHQGGGQCPRTQYSEKSYVSSYNGDYRTQALSD